MSCNTQSAVVQNTVLYCTVLYYCAALLQTPSTEAEVEDKVKVKVEVEVEVIGPDPGIELLQ